MTENESIQSPEKIASGSIVIRRAEDGILLELTMPGQQKPEMIQPDHVQSQMSEPVRQAETFYYWFNGEDIREADEVTAKCILQPGTEVVENLREKRRILDEVLEVADWVAYDKEKNEMAERLLDFADRYGE